MARSTFATTSVVENFRNFLVVFEVVVEKSFGNESFWGSGVTRVLGGLGLPRGVGIVLNFAVLTVSVGIDFFVAGWKMWGGGCNTLNNAGLSIYRVMLCRVKSLSRMAREVTLLAN